MKVAELRTLIAPEEDSLALLANTGKSIRSSCLTTLLSNGLYMRLENSSFTFSGGLLHTDWILTFFNGTRSVVNPIPNNSDEHTCNWQCRIILFQLPNNEGRAHQPDRKITGISVLLTAESYRNLMKTFFMPYYSIKIICFCCWKFNSSSNPRSRARTRNSQAVLKVNVIKLLKENYPQWKHSFSIIIRWERIL